MQQRYYEEESPRRVRPPIDEVGDQETTILPKKKRKGASPPDPWKPGSDQKRAVAPPVVEKPDFDSQGYIRGEVVYEQGAPSIPVIHQYEDRAQEAFAEEQGSWVDIPMPYGRILLVVLFVIGPLLLVAHHLGLLSLFHL